MQKVKVVDIGAQQLELLGLWTLSIVGNSE
jgi:hypothetical protein